MAGGTVSIGFDYRKQLDKAVKDIEKSFDMALSSKSYGKDFERQIASFKDMLSELKESLNDSFSGISTGKLDTDKFDAFRAKVTKDFQRVDSEIDSLNKSMKTLNDLLGITGDGVDLSSAINQFKELQDFVNANNEAVTKLLKTLKGTNNSVVFEAPTFSIDDAKSKINELKQLYSDLDFDAEDKYKDFDKSKDIQNEFKKLAKEYDVLFEKRGELQDKIDESVDQPEEFLLNLRAELSKTELQIGKVSESMMVLFSKAKDRKFTWVNDQSLKLANSGAVGISEELKQIQLNAKSIMSDLQKYVDVVDSSTARISDKMDENTGEVKLQVKISTRDKTLLNELKDKIDKLQSQLNMHPLILPVKMVVSNARTTSENPLKTSADAIKKAQKALQDETSNVQMETEELPKQTLKQALINAERAAKESQKRIQEVFDAVPIQVHFEVLPEEIEKVSRAIFDENGETKVDISGQIDKTIQHVDSLLAKLKDVDKQVNETKTNNKFKGLSEEIKKSLTGLESLKEIIISIRDLESTLARATNVATSGDITQQWNKIKFWFDYISDEKDNLNFSKQQKQLETLMAEYQKYINMGGKNPLRNLTDNQETKDFLYTLYNAYSTGEKKVVSEMAPGEIKSVESVNQAVDALTNAIGVEKVAAINKEAAEMESAAQREVVAIRSIDDEIKNLIVRLSEKSSFKINITPIIKSKDFSLAFEEMIKKTFSNSGLSFSDQMKSIGTGISDIISQMLEADRIQYDSKSPTYERVLALNKNGYYSNQFVVGTEHSIYNDIIYKLIDSAEQLNETIDTVLHTHPMRNSAEMSAPYYSKSKDGKKRLHYGDLSGFFDLYNKNGINTEITVSQNNAQVFDAKKFYDKYSKIFNFMSKEFAEDFAKIDERLFSDFDNDISLYMQFFERINDFQLSMDKIMPKGSSRNKHSEINTAIQTYFGSTVDDLNKILTKDFLTYSKNLQNNGYENNVKELFARYFNNIIDNALKSLNISDITNADKDHYIQTLKANFAFEYNKIKDKYDATQYSVVRDEAFSSMLLNEKIKGNKNVDISDRLENYYKIISLEDLYKEYANNDGIKKATQNVDIEGIIKEIIKEYVESAAYSSGKINKQDKELKKENIQNIDESSSKITEESSALDKTAESAANAAEAKDKFRKSNELLATSAKDSADALAIETNAMQVIENIDLDHNSDEFRNAAEAARMYCDGLGEIASITRTSGTYNAYNKNTGEMEQMLKTSYRVTDVNGNSRTFNPNGDLIGSKDIVNISAAYREYLKIQEEIYNLNLKEAKGQKLTAEELSKRLQLLNNIEKQSDILFDFEQRGLKNAEMRDEILRRNEAYNQTIIDAQTKRLVEDPVKGFEEKIAKLDTNKNLSKQTDEYKDRLNDIKVLIEQLKSYGQNGITLFNPDTVNEIDEIKNKINSLFSNISEMYKAANQAKATSLISNIEDYLAKNSSLNMTSKGRGFISELRELQGELKNADLTSDNLQDIVVKFNNIKTAITEAGLAGRSFFDVIKSKAFYMAAETLARLFSINDIIRYGRTIFNTIKELDTALVDLRKTAKMSVSELNNFYKASNSIAKQMGVTTKEIINQAAAWSRLGYSTADQAEKMAALSSQFAAVSPDMDVNQATDGLVSSMKAFRIEVDNVERDVMDNINRIGNTMATTNGEIVDMLTRSSAAMAAANNTIQETIALESAAVEITRNAETTGTAFKTVAMRIRGYDEETEELSEDLKNISGDIADLTKINGKGGISLFTDETKQTYKSTYQILKEIADIWDQISDKNQAQLLEKISGKRGAQVVAGVISNFSAAEKAMNEMTNAAGSADAEMSIIESSIDYKINRFKETWVGVAQELIDRGDIGKIVDGFTAISEAIALITKNLGLLGTVGAVGGGILGAKNLGRSKKFLLNSLTI